MFIFNPLKYGMGFCTGGQTAVVAHVMPKVAQISFNDSFNLLTALREKTFEP